MPELEPKDKVPERPTEQAGDPGELSPENLKRLFEELTAAGALPGLIASESDDRAKGLAFLIRDLDRDAIRDLVQKVHFTLPLSEPSLAALEAVRRLAEENRNLRELSVTDNLTGLFNTRFFWDRLRIELERGRRSERPCSLIMIDLDNFKPVNDNHGHQVGDRLLRDTAEILTKGVRAVDVPIRYGGDEFAVIMADTDVRDGLNMAERLRRLLEEDERTAAYGVTGSFGLATQRHFDWDDAEALVKRADDSLYRAKGAGGNRVYAADEDLIKEVDDGVSVSEKDDLFAALKME